MPRATPRTCTCTASPTEAERAGWPAPKAKVTRISTRASSTGESTAEPQAARNSDSDEAMAPMASVRTAPIRVSNGPVNRGISTATTEDGSSSTPTCQGSQPASPTSTAGTAISSPNHAAGTAAAASAERTTTGLRITSRGRNPSGRRRTCSATSGVPSPSSSSPTSAITRPVEGDWISSTSPAAVSATRIAPSTSRRAPLPSVVSARHTNGITSAPSIGIAITARHPKAASVSPPSSGPRLVTAAAVPASRPRASPRTAPSYRPLRIATPSVGTAAAPAPCTSRAKRSTPYVGASAASSAPPVIRPMPTSSGVRMPTRSEKRP